MQRREFIGLIGGMTAWPLAVRAQQSTRIPRIGYLSFLSAAQHKIRSDAFLEGLLKLGYVEGRNLQIEYRFADGNVDLMPGLAAQLVALNVDVIVTYAGGVAVSQRATATIPIVMATYGDAVATGIVASLAHPGGNITGSTFFSPQLMAKRLEYLKEVSPSVVRVGVLLFRGNEQNGPILEVMGLTAGALGMRLQPIEVGRAADLEGAVSEFTNQRIDALVVSDHALFVGNPKAAADVAAKLRVPSIGPVEFAASGGLMAYAVNLPEQFRRAGYFLDKILKGEKPGNIPVEQATRFVTMVNLKTAKELGLTVPPALLARADEVIE